MRLFCACLLLVLALSYASGCGSYLKKYKSRRFKKGVYITATSTSYMSLFFEFLHYSHRGNDQREVIKLGPLIVQVEKPCAGSVSPKKLVFSRKLPDAYTDNPPQPLTGNLKIDYQLGSSEVFYSKNIITFFPWLVVREVYKFMKELQCDNKSIIDKWFYIAYNAAFPTGYGEIRLQLKTGYTSINRTRCPPDDSNIEQLCKGKSAYSCPNMTFKETNGVAVRNVSMYIVTGVPTPGVNCSFNSARFIQYMGNHHYFMGRNSQSKKMLRTIPVMTKAIRVSSHTDPCQKKYQMQFYVNTAHLNESNLPCPTQPGVLLQKVENMQIYVKTFNGNPNTDMSNAKDMFTRELDRKNLNYINGRHYIAQYRGHGPVYGRTMEIWVEKTEPRYVTVCQGSTGAPETSTPTYVETTTTTAPKPSTDSLMISYY